METNAQLRNASALPVRTTAAAAKLPWEGHLQRMGHSEIPQNIHGFQTRSGENYSAVDGRQKLTVVEEGSTAWRHGHTPFLRPCFRAARGKIRVIYLIA